MPDVEFIPLGTLASDDEGGTTLDYARSRGRWQALPDGWLSAKDMREALMQVAHVPEWDGAAGEALLVAMEDFLEWRGSGAAREYRRVAEPPTPLTPSQILEAETARRAEVERERHEREAQARIDVNRERNQVFFDNQRNVHRELADEYTVPMIRALEARVAELERPQTQHGELEAVEAASTTTATPNEAPSEAPASREWRGRGGSCSATRVTPRSSACWRRRRTKTSSETAQGRLG